MLRSATRLSRSGLSPPGVRAVVSDSEPVAVLGSGRSAGSPFGGACSARLSAGGTALGARLDSWLSGARHAVSTAAATAISSQRRQGCLPDHTAVSHAMRFIDRLPGRSMLRSYCVRVIGTVSPANGSRAPTRVGRPARHSAGAGTTALLWRSQWHPEAAGLCWVPLSVPRPLRQVLPPALAGSLGQHGSRAGTGTGTGP